MFKKKVLLVLVLLLSVSLLFAGGKKEASGSEKSEVTKELIFGTSGVGGSWYPVATKIGAILSEDTRYEMVVQASGGGIENLRLLQAGEYQLGWAESNVAHASYNGKKIFEKAGAN